MGHGSDDILITTIVKKRALKWQDHCKKDRFDIAMDFTKMHT